jgi:hypothetical protein
MPHLDSELNRVAGSSVFATFDLSQGYWQLSLDVDSQDCQSFITPDGVFTPTRVLHGTTNAVPHFQACVQGILGDLSENILAWLDDLLMYAMNEPALLKLLRLFFQLCRDYNLKLHPGKCVLFSKMVRWCGRLISFNGVRFDPRRVQALHDMVLPLTGADLQQFVCALNWMRTSIPSFATIIYPLQELLEEVYSHAGKRTKSAISKIPLSKVGWSQSHADSFRMCQKAIEHAVTLALPISNKRLCVYSDASSVFWSFVITKVPPEHLDRPTNEKHHEPLAFFSGKFTSSSSWWHIIEEEAYAIMEACDKLSWLLHRPDGFSIFTDHHNLTYIFNPYGHNPGLSSHTAAKILRWALKLSSYRYKIEHVPGVENIWPDLLTRWAAPMARGRVSALMLAPLSPTEDVDFVWPSAAEVRATQDKYVNSLAVTDSAESQDLVQLNKDGLYRTSEGRIWIPAECTDLQLRICVVGHTGLSGHRGTKTTVYHIRSMFYWPTLQEDIAMFCSTCLHCCSYLGGDI